MFSKKSELPNIRPAIAACFDAVCRGYSPNEIAGRLTLCWRGYPPEPRFIATQAQRWIEEFLAALDAQDDEQAASALADVLIHLLLLAGIGHVDLQDEIASRLVGASKPGDVFRLPPIRDGGTG